jgi:organic radical activating enzyme
MEQNFIKEFKLRNLDAVSPTFCAAKWLDATIWLSEGFSTSCHHNPLHRINLDDLATNPSALHNTEQKRLERQAMLRGEQPSGCQYCWKIENETSSFSDRVYKSYGIGQDNIIKLKLAGLEDQNPQLRTLEISFDNVCNMACLYCNQSFSNKWDNDLKKFGPYININSETSNNYKNPKDQLPPDEIKKYVDAFWQWWPDLKKNLKWFRITGGEPLLNDNTWKIIEDLANDKSSLHLMINTNLNHKPAIIEKLIEHKNMYPNMSLFTSLESMGPHAEYVRDGLDLELWKSNLLKLLDNGIKIHIMTTVNILSLDSITDFYEFCINLQAQGKSLSYDCNLLRYPRFLAIGNLSQELKDYYLEKLSAWFETNANRITNEKYQIEKLIDYIKKVEHPDQHNQFYSKENLRLELKDFLRQFDIRRLKSHKEIFDPKLVNWINNG